MMKTLLVLVATLASCSAQRWCCKSPAELKKCEYLSELHYDSTSTANFPFVCVEGQGTEDCIHKIIEHNLADLMILDGGDIFEYRHNLTVAAAEDYGNGEGTSYHAVAVVKHNARSDLTLRNIAGATSCHTGVGKTSGWNMPMGWFKRNSVNPDGFDSSCAPGAKDDDYIHKVPGNQYNKWCQNCIGDKQHMHICARNDAERYYGYHGALRCLQDGAGEVAFIKETVALKAVNSSDLRLLCPNGERMLPTEWRVCNLGRVPSHAVVMRENTPQEVKDDVFYALEHARQSMDKNMFNQYHGKNLLWGSKTAIFKRVTSSVDKFIGHDFLCNMYSLNYNQKLPDC